MITQVSKQRILELQATVERMQDALDSYGSHLPTCKIFLRNACLCGFGKFDETYAKGSEYLVDLRDHEAKVLSELVAAIESKDYSTVQEVTEHIRDSISKLQMWAILCKKS